MLKRYTIFLSGIIILVALVITVVAWVGATGSEQPASQPANVRPASDIELIALDFPDQSTKTYATFKIEHNSIPSDELVLAIVRGDHPIVKMSFEIVDRSGQVVYSTANDKSLQAVPDLTIRTIHLNKPIATNHIVHPDLKDHEPVLIGRNFSCVRK